MSTHEQPTGRDELAPFDESAPSELASRSWLLWGGIFVALISLLVWWIAAAVRPAGAEVIIFCAQDQIYAEPIFKDFRNETGVKVRAVFDSEAVKSVGLANRLLAERSHPQCDVFWGNEELRTRQLLSRDVFRPTNAWAAFGARSRRIVINTNLLTMTRAPRSLLELTNPSLSGKVALAYPQFGTTATYFHALRQLWGPAQWESWCRALAGNKPFLVDGNSVVVKLVGKGEAWIGLTDSDDVADGQHEGLPILPLPVTAETLWIPNTVAVIRGAPHPGPAQLLFDYLQRPEIVQRLVEAQALEAVALDNPNRATLKVDWDSLLQDLDSTTAKLNEIFLR